jgi:hypothetical protein
VFAQEFMLNILNEQQSFNGYPRFDHGTVQSEHAGEIEEQI